MYHNNVVHNCLLSLASGITAILFLHRLIHRLQAWWRETIHKQRSWIYAIRKTATYCTCVHLADTFNQIIRKKTTQQ